MLYDLAQAPPEPGSLLESVLLIVAKRRQEAEWLGTKCLMLANMAEHLKGDALQKIVDVYTDTMFPFLGKHTQERDKLAKKAVKAWTGVGPLRVKPLWLNRDQRAVQSRLRRTAAKLQEQERKRPRGRRI
jgi:hypothetical protein